MEAALPYVEEVTPARLAQAETLVEGALVGTDLSALYPGLAATDVGDPPQPLSIPQNGDPQLVEAYGNICKDEYDMLRRLGPQHWAQMNERLEDTLYLIEDAVSRKRAQVELVNQQRQTRQQSSMRLIEEAESYWRDTVGNLIDTQAEIADLQQKLSGQEH